MKQSRVLTTLALLGVAAFSLSAISADEPAKEKKAAVVKCPVSGQPAKAEHTAAYKEGKVQFCCPNCPTAFEKDTAKFATKANHQLVQTGQYVGKACPISGRDLNAEESVKVAGVKVSFCCPNCKGKVAELKGKKKLEAVFAEKPFEKGFAPKEKKES